MNKPTPIGKKTFAEYEKEVNDYKEFNLGKVEKVELGLVDDLEKIIQNTNSEYKTMLKEKDKFFKANDDLKKVANKVFEGEQKILTLRDKLVKAVKDLGVENPDIVTRAEKLAAIYFKEADMMLKIAKY